MRTNPIKTVEELFPEEANSKQSDKKALMRLIGLSEWPSLLQVCFTANPSNTEVIELFIQYCTQVAFVLRKKTLQSICEDVLKQLDINRVFTLVAEYGCNHHLVGTFLCSNYQMTGFEQNVCEFILKCVIKYLECGQWYRFSLAFI